MKRNERKQANATNYPASLLSWLNEVTDSIYDDFESRICANCKHLTPVGVCMNKKSFCFDMSMVDNEQIAYFSGVSKDEFDNFGCNKFERVCNERG